jgi:GT2 family glycosyltransferase
VSISVVVVNWNSRDDLAECLASLDGQTDRDFEIVVSDNGSTDGSIELVRERFPRVVLLENNANLGFAEGCNRGIERATGSWIALLNNDATAAPNWIEELRRAADAAGPRLGMLQSRLVFKQHPDRTNSTGVVLFKDGCAVDRDFDAPLRADDSFEEVFCITAGAGLYRRAMLDSVRLPSGIFDRTYFMYYEDLDLGWRCRLAGWDAFYVPSAVVYHAFQGSSHRRGANFVERHCKRNRIRTLVKNGSLPFLLRTLPKTVRDVRELVTWDGLGALREVATAVRDAVPQRAEVAKLAQRSRREVEGRWVR